MEKNYYKILEIDKNASREIVDKAYKTLVLKYHPDLQETSLKSDYEEKLKLINEAYDILSNDEKRKSYDAQLEQDEIESQKITDELLNENRILKDELYRVKQHNYNSINQSTNDIQNSSYNNINLNNQNTLYEEYLRQARKNAYKNTVYRTNPSKTWKYLMKDILAVVITIAILFLLYQIPFIKDFFTDLYNENKVIQYFVEFFQNLSK